MEAGTKTNSTFKGRRVIYSSFKSVNRDNICTLINEAMLVHTVNKAEILYLESYKRGVQPILNRKKTIRPEINNKIVVNRAHEIVAFTTGYLLGEPIQYISNENSEEHINAIKALNEYCSSVDKQFLDNELKEISSTCGTSYRLTLPTSAKDDVPFKMYNLDPEDTFVIYSSGLGHKPLLGVTVVFERDEHNDERTRYCCYSDTEYYEVVDNVIVECTPHVLGMIPIIEYPNNRSRLGDFEIVIPILDAINLVYSNRMDGVEQFVQSLMKFINVDISQDDFKQLLELGAIKVTKTGEDSGTQDVQFMTQELNQQQVQTLIKSLYEDVLTICSMPNRNGGSSTSDTGAAVIMRDGWESAEAKAKASELIFKRSERKTLSIILHCMETFKSIVIGNSDIDIKFTRRNYENVSQKATVLTTMLGSDKIHPKLAFEHCGLFSDPETAYIVSKNYKEEMQKLAMEIAKATNPNDEDNNNDEGAKGDNNENPNDGNEQNPTDK